MVMIFITMAAKQLSVDAMNKPVCLSMCRSLGRIARIIPYSVVSKLKSRLKTINSVCFYGKKARIHRYSACKIRLVDSVTGKTKSAELSISLF